jgi:hypothetical protein
MMQYGVASEIAGRGLFACFSAPRYDHPMSRELSPQSEQYLANAVASGLFPSTEAALEAAVEALREKTS